MTLAIETSCDDTSVAIVEKGVHDGNTVARLHFHQKVTSNNHEFQGVHPLLTLKSHQENLADLVADALQHLPNHQGTRRLPDFVSVTRGPGMRSNLMPGSGLAGIYHLVRFLPDCIYQLPQKPLVGVHHMQAHALTPRLVAALDSYNNSISSKNSNDEPLADGAGTLTPTFPILSVLASGGHTILIDSSSLTSHKILGSTDDIAVGECLDKTARAILPTSVMEGAKSTMYGALLEEFACPHPTSPGSATELSGLTANQYTERHGHVHAWYTPPANNEIALQRSRTAWGWSIAPPLLTTGGGTKINSLDMSFSGLMTAVERIVRFPTDPLTGKLGAEPRHADDISLEERKDMALGVQRAAFEHIASRVVRALSSTTHTHAHTHTDKMPAVVLAGGVASNAFLRHVLATTLVLHGHGHVELFFPPPKYCTDNAAMIGWTGIEMFEAGYTDGLGIRAVRKWPLDELLEPRYHDKI
ncbi:Mitochondrial tRNAs modification protein [Didymella sp. IMI 355093]|nr:Mitochondrial tRNAs modification protein [Didymella sp. IMI 355093]